MSSEQNVIQERRAITPALARRIEIWPVDRLIPYARNARTHSEAQIAQIAGSIREFGFNAPILVDSNDGIIAGHGRLLAARKLGMAEVPVVVLDHLSDTQRRAYIIADNRLALSADWDEEMLRVELASLQEDDFDLDVIGFSDEELEELLIEPEEEFSGLTGEDVIPEPEEHIVTIPGDVWLMNDHRLLCGDATNPDAIRTILAGGLADMVFTDPPYNVDYEGKTAKKLKIDNDALGSSFYDFLHTISRNLLEVTKGAIYVCMSSSELHTLHEAFTDAGGHWSTFIVWAKHHFTLGRSDYQRQYEPILYGWRKGVDHFWCGDRDQGDVWFIKRPAASTQHPIVKPVELIERAIRNSSKTRDTVLDPFGGSGTALIACEKSGRQARLIELEPKYCDVIIRRWQAYTGHEAKLESNGATYAETARARMSVAA
jgi:DNA modification methylase